MEKNIEKALDIMLKALGNEDCKEAVMKEITSGNTVFEPKQLNKTRFKFWGIGSTLGILAFTFIVELDTSKYDNLVNYVSKQHRCRFDMFEFEKYDDCIIAFD